MGIENNSKYMQFVHNIHNNYSGQRKFYVVMIVLKKDYKFLKLRHTIDHNQNVIFLALN